MLPGMRAPRDAFPYRPLGVPPSLRRRHAVSELERPWTMEEILVLCPPPDLILPLVIKLQATRAPALLLLPDWPRQPWQAPAVRLVSQIDRLSHPPTEVWVQNKRLNAHWRLLKLSINI